jgi:hypothetical protein
VKDTDDFEEPGVGFGVLDLIKVACDSTAAVIGIEVVRGILRWHARRVHLFGVVVVAEDLIPVACGGLVGIDVGVAIEDRPALDFGEEPGGELGVCVHDGWYPIGREFDLKRVWLRTWNR